MESYGLDSNELTSRKHIDLYYLLKRCFIFPIQEYKLKNIGKLFGYPFKHTELDGIAVALKYLNHIETNKPLEKEVLEYSEDDVKVLPFLIKTIQENKDIIMKDPNVRDNSRPKIPSIIRCKLQYTENPP